MLFFVHDILVEEVVVVVNAMVNAEGEFDTVAAFKSAQLVALLIPSTNKRGALAAVPWRNAKRPKVVASTVAPPMVATVAKVGSVVGKPLVKL